MNSLIRLIIIGLTVYPLVLSAQKSITVDDLWMSDKFSAQFIWGMDHLNDGSHFSKIEYDQSANEMKITSYDYEKGEANETLFSSKWVKGNEGFMFEDYSFNQDETKILLSTQTEGIYRYSSKSFYYVFDRKTKFITRLSDDSKQMYAHFSPDGSKVGYVMDNNLYYLDLEKNKTYQVTDDGEWNKIINGASDWVYEEELVVTRAFEWSPDGSRLAYLRFDETKVPEFSMPIYGGLYPVNYNFKYPKAGEKNSIVSLFIYNLDKKSHLEVPLDDGEEFYIPRIEWTKDPKLLSVQKLNRHQNKLDFLLAHAKTGKLTTLFTEENPYYIDITDDLTFLDNGKEFIWSSEQDGYNHLYLFDMDGKMKKQLTKGPWDVTAFLGYDPDRKICYYQSSEESPMERHIYSVKINGKGKEKLTSVPGQHSFDFTADYSFYVAEFSSTEQPTTFNVFDQDGQLIRKLEDNAVLKNTIEEHGWADREYFDFSLTDGTQLNGWMIKPPGFDANKEYPVFMYVYGGPGSQTVENAWGGRNDVWFQLIAQKGYIVVSVDNRGTGARGQEFKKMTYLKLGEIEYRDQVAAARYLGDLNYVDAERIGIFGWSYGAYVSSLCLFRSPELFKMAIAVAPVSNWKFYDTIYTERFMRTPQENHDGYENGAPINYVAGLEGKYLLVHGTADDNVHIQNSLELVTALVNAGKDFDLFFYPNKNHGIGGRSTRLHLYNKMTRFIGDNL